MASTDVLIKRGMFGKVKTDGSNIVISPANEAYAYTQVIRPSEIWTDTPTTSLFSSSFTNVTMTDINAGVTGLVKRSWKLPDVNCPVVPPTYDIAFTPLLQYGAAAVNQDLYPFNFDYSAGIVTFLDTLPPFGASNLSCTAYKYTGNYGASDASQLTKGTLSSNLMASNQPNIISLGNLTSLRVTGIASTGGNVGVATTIPRRTLHVEGDVFFTGSLYQGTSNSLFINSQWLTSNTNIYYTAGNVGINSTVPTAKLDVSGTFKATSGSVGNMVLNGATETFNGAGGSENQTLTNFLRFNTGRQHSLIGDGLDNLQIWWGAGGSYIPRVSFGNSGTWFTSGNFGIGTSNPGYLLDVAGATRVSNLYADSAIGVGTTTTAARLHVYNNNSSASTALIVEDDGAYEYPAAAMTSNTTYIAGTVYGEGLYVASASTELASYQAWGAFNKTVGGSTINTNWMSSSGVYNAATGAYTGAATTNGYAGEWLQIQLPSPIVVSSFRLISRSHATRGDPKDFAVFASHDGQVWGRVFATSGAVFAISETKTFTVTTPAPPCKYFRLVINATTPYTSATFASAAEWYINGVTNIAPQMTVRSDQVALDGVKVAIGKQYASAPLEVFDTSSSSGFEFPPFVMTADTTMRFDAKYGNGTYVASGSTIQNSSYPASSAFAKLNATDSNCWASATTYSSTTGVYTGSIFTTPATGSNYLGEYLQIQVPEPITLESLQFSSRNSTNTRGDPKSWAVFGSLDGVAFNQLFATTTEPSWATATARTYTIGGGNNMVPYTYYRLAVNEIYNTGAAGYASIADLRLYGKTLSKVNHLQVSNGVVQVSEYARLGIGAAAPNAPLHVQGNALIGANTNYASYRTSGTNLFTPAADGLINGVNITALNQRTRASFGPIHTALNTWTTRASASDINWVGVCWAPELSLFAACASNTTANSIMTSPDCVSWTTRTTASGPYYTSICWAPQLSLFVAVGYTGTNFTAITSPDGITWTARATTFASVIPTAVVWASELGLFVAVANSGTGNRVITSADGTTWTTRTSAADNAWSALCWAPELSLLVAVSTSGSGNRVMTSTNGITWAIRSSAADISWDSVCWSPELGLFVAVAITGTGNRVMTSPNGILWTTRTSAADNNWTSVIWAPEISRFIAVSATGTGNCVMTSADGINWVTRASAANNAWNAVVWSAELSRCVAVASSGTGTRVMTSAMCLPNAQNTLLVQNTLLNVSQTGILTFDQTSNATAGSGTIANKIRMFDTSGAVFGFGVESNAMALHSGNTFNWYTGSTQSAYGTIRMRLDNSGNLLVASDITAYSSFSDARLKTDVIPVTNSLDTVLQLKPVDFKWNDCISARDKVGTEDVGFIAQEVEQILPKVVSSATMIHDNCVYKSIKYDKVVPYLVKALQEMHEKLEKAEQRISDLESKHA